MKEIVNISIIGAEDVRTRIGNLFSKAGLEVTLGNEFNGAMAAADLVLDCLPDNMERRKEAWRNWDKKVQSEAILSAEAPGSITEIAGVTIRPDKVIGLNFVFKPPDNKSVVVQIVRCLETSDVTVERCWSLVQKTGALPILVLDSPGLVLERPMACMVNEAAIMYSTGVASVEDIDRIPKLCLNWPMGPFEFADTIGLDRVLAVLESLSASDGPKFLPCRLLKEMVTMNRLGKKTGRGFYHYS